jgi:hypothetical protein
VIRVASSAPNGPGTSRNLTAVSGATVRLPSAMAVQWNGKRSPPFASISPRPANSSKLAIRPD